MYVSQKRLKLSLTPSIQRCNQVCWLGRHGFLNDAEKSSQVKSHCLIMKYYVNILRNGFTIKLKHAMKSYDFI